MLGLFGRAVVPSLAAPLTSPPQAPGRPIVVRQFARLWARYIYMTDVLRCKNFTTCAAVYV